MIIIIKTVFIRIYIYIFFDVIQLLAGHVFDSDIYIATYVSELSSKISSQTVPRSPLLFSTTRIPSTHPSPQVMSPRLVQMYTEYIINKQYNKQYNRSN